MSPEIFGPGSVSTRGREFATSFTPDGETVFVNRVNDGRILLMRSHAEGDGWTAQESVPFSDGSYPVVDPFVSFDGNRLYFSSTGPKDQVGDKSDFSLWYTDLVEGEWSLHPTQLKALDHPGSDVFCTLTRAGLIYFSSRAADNPRVLMVAKPNAHGWSAPRHLELGTRDASIGNPLIAQDGSFLVFTADLPTGLGGVDLYLCLRDAEGNWSSPTLLPEPINSPYSDFAPALSPDGRAFFFTSERPGMVRGEVAGRRPGDIYWVQTSALGL